MKGNFLFGGFGFQLKSVVLSLCSLLLFLGLWLPFLKVEIAGRVVDFSLLNLLFDAGDLIDLLILLFLFLVPLLYWFCVLFLLHALYLGSKSMLAFVCAKCVQVLREFLFLDVLLVSIFLALLKLSDLGELSFELGFVLFFLLVVFGSMLNFHFVRTGFYEHVKHYFRPAENFFLTRIFKPKHITPAVLSFACSGGIFYVASHMLPMMDTSFFGDADSNTILSGVLIFFDHGDYLIGVVIFVASVVIPVLKFFTVFLVVLRYFFGVPIDGKFLSFYKVMWHLGRWSMIDFFVVAVLSALVRFDNVAMISPNWGSVMFLLSVVCTMFSFILLNQKMRVA